jgi:hypothetical protein
MEWRRPIEEQKPFAAGPSHGLRPQKPSTDDFAHSPEYRAAAGNPALYELAVRANAYKERLLREARD